MLLHINVGYGYAFELLNKLYLFMGLSCSVCAFFGVVTAMVDKPYGHSDSTFGYYFCNRLVNPHIACGCILMIVHTSSFIPMIYVATTIVGNS